MKILFVYRYAILGGVTTQLSNRLCVLQDGIEAYFGFLEDHGGLQAFGDYPHTRLFRKSEELRAFVKAAELDMILVVDTPEAYQPILDSGFSGTIVNEVHTTTRNLDYLKDLPCMWVDAMITPSKYLAGRIEGEYGFKGRIPCFVAPNCVDTERFRLAQPTASLNGPVVLWVGKLDDHKNWRGFLEAAAAIAASRQDCSFWMVGGESAADGVALELLEEAGRLRLLQRLHWLPRIEYEQMPAVYSAVAASGGVCLSTSRDEAFGMSIVEAMACGCPAVAAAVGAIPEILEGRLSRNLYPFGNTERMVALSLQAMDGVDRPSMAALGRKVAVSKYSIEQAGMNYRRLLDQVQRLR